MAQSITLDVKGVPKGSVQLQSLHVTEALGALTVVEIDMVARRADLAADKILGKDATVRIETRAGGPRFFHGYVTRFARHGMRGRFHAYRLTVHPALWFLSRTSDCKIFQDRTVLDIVKGILRDDHPLVKFDDRTSREYRSWNYCVQYNESDLDFVMRLLEHEGIYFSFEHVDGEHTLVLRDDNAMHDPAPGYDTLPYFPSVGQAPPDTEWIETWSEASQVMPGKQVSVHFDALEPRPLTASFGVEKIHALGDAERFEYPDAYSSRDDHDAYGTQYMTDRLDAQLTGQRVIEAATACPGLRCGAALTLSRHPDPAQNAKYLLTAATLHVELTAFESGVGDAAPTFSCSFTAIPFDQQFRPAQVTRKPRSYGPQTAIVQTDNGDDVTVDDHGRVKVQFHWDRYGKNDARSSCWVRVAQAWAGSGMGAVFIPRRGHEVIVSFLNGDFDQPIITGGVYNGANPLPFGQQASPTQSGFMSRSHKGAGGNANMFRFDDAKGGEKVELHGERDIVMTAENDFVKHAQHDMSLAADHDQTLSAGNDQHLHVKKKRDSFIGDGETRVVKKNRITAVEVNEVISAKNILSFATDTWGVSAKTGVIDTKSALGFKVGGGTTLLSDGPVLMKGSKFGFTTTGDMKFSANKFDRTVGETNDTVLGAMTGTNLGPMSLTQFGGAESFVSGRASSFYLGVASSTAVAMQIQNVIGVAMSTTVANISNVVLQAGMTAFNLGMNGISLDNNSLKVFSAGGAGSSAAGAAAGPGLASTTAGMIGSVLGFGALGISGVAGLETYSSQKERAERDRKEQLDKLTPEMRKALEKAANFDTVKEFNENKPFTDDELKAQLQKSGDEVLDPNAAALNAMLDDPKLSPDQRRQVENEIKSRNDQAAAQQLLSPAIDPTDPSKTPDFRKQAKELQDGPPPEFPAAPGPTSPGAATPR